MLEQHDVNKEAAENDDKDKQISCNETKILIRYRAIILNNWLYDSI